MRGSLVFQLYFVMGDSLFQVAHIIMVVYCTLFFFLEVRKSSAFRAAATNAAKKRPFWTRQRVAFLSSAVLTVATWVSQIIFAVYWLIIDFDGVFLIEIIRYIELFYYYSITAYLFLLSFVKLLQVKVCGK